MGQGVGRAGAWRAGRREREAGWRRHLAAWRGSGLTQAEYARRHSLKPADFSWWKHELARRDRQVRREATRAVARPAPRTPPLFVPVALTTTADSAACEVLLRNGRRLRVGGGAESAWVAELAAALEAAGSC
jgi:hypothetical protein